MTDGCDDDTCVSEANQSVVDTQLESGTTYYLVIWLFSTTAPTAGNTAVQPCIQQLPTPPTAPNDTCAGTIPLTPNIPVATNSGGFTGNDYQLAPASACFPAGHTASTATGRDVVYSFTAPAAGQYSFRATSYYPIGSSNAVVYLANSCPAATPGTPVTVTCSAAANIASGSAEELNCVTLAMNEQVFLFSDEAVLGSGANFFALVESCGPLEVESNNTPGTANAFQCGIQGAINPPTEADFYSIGTPAASSRIFAVIDSATAGPSADQDLRVNNTTDTLEYDDAGNDLNVGSISGNIAGGAATGAALFLQVDNFGTTSTLTGSPYRLYAVVQPEIAMATPETEDNGTIAAANSAVNNYFSGSLAGPSPSTDLDVYGFQAVAGDLIYVGFDGDPLRDLTPLNAKVELLDASGNILVTVNDGGSTSTNTSGAGNLFATTPNSPAEAIVLRSPTSGNLYVRVTAGSTSATTAAGDYLLSISRSCQTAGGGLSTAAKDSIGIRDAGNNFFLRNSNSNGAVNLVFTFGTASDVPLAGDWDGDGDDTIGVYRPSTGQFFMRNSNSSGPADIAFTFGGSGAGIVPITGDWDNNGTDTIGLYIQSTAVFFLRNSNSNGPADLTFTYGGPDPDYRPLTGDWDGDGDDTVGLYVQDTGVFFLRNSNSNGPANLTFTYGGPDSNYRPLDGDWDGNVTDTVGLYNFANGVVFLRNSNTNGPADVTFQYGVGGATPLAGDWDNLP